MLCKGCGIKMVEKLSRLPDISRFECPMCGLVCQVLLSTGLGISRDIHFYYTPEELQKDSKMFGGIKYEVLYWDYYEDKMDLSDKAIGTVVHCDEFGSGKMVYKVQLTSEYICYNSTILYWTYILFDNCSLPICESPPGYFFHVIYDNWGRKYVGPGVEAAYTLRYFSPVVEKDLPRRIKIRR
jgi:hypothetical protein